MFKKLTLVAMSVAALAAFAIPAVAQGAEITDSLGEPAQNITAFSTNTVTTSGGSSLECATVDLDLTRTGTGTYHGTGYAKGHINEGPTHLKHTCTIEPEGTIATVESVTVKDVHINGGGTGTAEFSFTFKVAGVLMCTSGGKVNLTYTPTSDEASVSGKIKGSENTAFGCPPESEITGDFTITDELGEPVVIH